MKSDLWALLALSVGLAMDAVAVSASAGLTLKRARLQQALRLGLTFGLFQSGMAMLGWLVGAEAMRYIARWDHWVAFGLLAIIGGKMIRDGLAEQTEPAPALLNTRTLLVLGVATSIDSLAAGLTLPMLGLPLQLSAGVIGVTTFLLSLGAALAAQRLGETIGGKLEFLGGVVLIGIGLHILIEHLAGQG